MNQSLISINQSIENNESIIDINQSSIENNESIIDINQSMIENNRIND